MLNKQLKSNIKNLKKEQIELKLRKSKNIIKIRVELNEIKNKNFRNINVKKSFYFKV